MGIVGESVESRQNYTCVSVLKLRDLEGEGNHSTSVISRFGLVGGGGAVVMV